MIVAIYWSISDASYCLPGLVFCILANGNKADLSIRYSVFDQSIESWNIIYTLILPSCPRPLFSSNESAGGIVRNEPGSGDFPQGDWAKNDSIAELRKRLRGKKVSVPFIPIFGHRSHVTTTTTMTEAEEGEGRRRAREGHSSHQKVKGDSRQRQSQQQHQQQQQQSQLQQQQQRRGTGDLLSGRLPCSILW